MDSFIWLFETRGGFDIVKFLLSVVPMSVSSLRKQNIRRQSAFRIVSVLIFNAVLIYTQLRSWPGFFLNILQFPFRRKGNVENLVDEMLYPQLCTIKEDYGRLDPEQKQCIDKAYDKALILKNRFSNVRQKLREAKVSQPVDRRLTICAGLIDHVEFELKFVIGRDDESAAISSVTGWFGQPHKCFKYKSLIVVFTIPVLGLDVFGTLDDSLSAAGTISYAICTICIKIRGLLNPNLTDVGMRALFYDYVGILTFTAPILSANRKYGFLKRSAIFWPIVSVSGSTSLFAPSLIFELFGILLVLPFKVMGSVVAKCHSGISSFLQAAGRNYGSFLPQVSA